MKTQKTTAAVPVYQLCLDTIRGDDISGSLYCGICPQGVPFSGIAEVLLTIDEIMDKIGFPQSTVDKRSFKKKDQPRNIVPPLANITTQGEMRRFDTTVQKGEKATFILKVKFRRNANWQGTVEWLEGKEEYSFNSELELLEFIDKASRRPLDS